MVKLHRQYINSCYIDKFTNTNTLKYKKKRTEFVAPNIDVLL